MTGIRLKYDSKKRSEDGKSASSLSLTEAAAFLGVCEKTLREMVEQNEIRCRRIGNKYLFGKSYLKKWINLEIDV